MVWSHSPHSRAPDDGRAGCRPRDVISGNDTALRITYDGQIGQTQQLHGFGLKGSIKF